MPAVFEQVRLSLQESREAGMTFDGAWGRAIAGLERPRGRMDGYEFANQLEALLETKPAWRRAYRRRAPTSKESAVVMVKMPA